MDQHSDGYIRPLSKTIITALIASFAISGCREVELPAPPTEPRFVRGSTRMALEATNGTFYEPNGEPVVMTNGGSLTLPNGGITELPNGGIVNLPNGGITNLPN